MSLVIELDDEWIGLVVDKKTAAKLLFLTGECSAADTDTTVVYGGLLKISEVSDMYDEFVGKVQGNPETAIKFPEVK